MSAKKLLTTLMGAFYKDDLADNDKICGLMCLQGEAISHSVLAIENVLVIGQPGRTDTLETQAIASKRATRAHNK